MLTGLLVAGLGSCSSRATLTRTRVLLVPSGEMSAQPVFRDPFCAFNSTNIALDFCAWTGVVCAGAVSDKVAANNARGTRYRVFIFQSERESPALQCREVGELPKLGPKNRHDGVRYVDIRSKRRHWVHSAQRASIEGALRAEIKEELTPALLRLDPMFDPLRNDPRFQKLATAPAKRNPK